MTRNEIADFGVTASGQAVQRLTLDNGALRVSLLTLGAIVQDVRLHGVDHRLTPGSDRLADYESGLHYHGALVAPVVNRLSGGAAPIAEVPHRFEPNQDGLHTLHSGKAGTHLKLWEVAALTATSVTLSVNLPDGEGGFPGNRQIVVAYGLYDATLRMQVTATTDRTTLFNVANHSYWNLDGSAGWAGHRLQVAADRYLPVTDSFAPTGEVRDVAGTPFDFRQPRSILPGQPPMDNSFCLSDRQRDLTPVLTLTGSDGVSMTLATTEPGLQIYDGRNPAQPGRGTYEALAIEAQNWPDAPNHAGFPDIELHPGQTYAQTTEWRFTRA